MLSPFVVVNITNTEIRTELLTQSRTKYLNSEKIANPIVS
jgi:hypothetical protein